MKQNSCKECIISAMCKKPCDEMVNELQSLLDSIVHKQLHPIIRSNFAEDMCREIREKPYADLKIFIVYKEGADLPCTIEIDKGSIIRLRQ